MEVRGLEEERRSLSSQEVLVGEDPMSAQSGFWFSLTAPAHFGSPLGSR